MREILFRGKRIDNGEWIEGHYGEYIRFEKPISAISIPSDDSFMGNLCYDVDASTVGQCVSGLTDKNGKKIFEGDIIFDPENKENYFVEFDEGGFCAGDMFLQAYISFDEFSCEVIGNIHDNPELLKGEREVEE